MSDRRFIVVSGLPASGKTSLARALSPLLDLPVIDKDDLLDQLFDAEGVGDLAWRRELSRRSDVLFRQQATASAGALLTSFWHVPGMAEASGTPTEWLHQLSPLVVGLHCQCSPMVAAERFMGRRRHPGHLDATRSLDEVRATLQELEGLGAPRLDDTVIVDTTCPVSTQAVVAELHAAFAQCGARRAAGGSRG